MRPIEEIRLALLVAKQPARQANPLMIVSGECSDVTCPLHFLPCNQLSQANSSWDQPHILCAAGCNPGDQGRQSARAANAMVTSDVSVPTHCQSPHTELVRGEGGKGVQVQEMRKKAKNRR